MTEKDNESSLAIERWRPKTLNDVCLSKKMRNYFQNCIDQKNIPHILLYGTQGIGKTTIGKVLAYELGADFLYINGSKEKNLDTLRGTIMTFISTYSDSNVWDDDGCTIKKILFIDEFDKITFQESLKVVLEENENNCRFILATNNISAIIDPIKDERCQTFNILPQEQDERIALALEYIDRLDLILKNEKFRGLPVKYDMNTVRQIVKRTFPSLRRAISTCSKTILMYNEISADIVFDEMISSSLIELINKKDVVGLRKFCANTDPLMFFREFYENFEKYVPDSEYVNVASVYGEFAWRNSRHDDREQNLFMFLVMLAQKLGDKFKIGK